MEQLLTPVHKLSGGTLCNVCRVIITDKFTDDLICDNCLTKHEQYRSSCKWTSIMDKDKKLLPEPITRMLTELSDNHLLSIKEFLEERNHRLVPMIMAELAVRQMYPLLRIEDYDMDL